MILNVWTVSAFFLAALGFVLAVAAGFTGVRCLGSRDPQRTGERAHLLALIVAVLALVRGIAWPHFYLLLESYVPAFAPQGVMCTWGVTQIEAELVLALQWLKPALLFLLAAWWALAELDRTLEPPAFLRLRSAMIVGIAALAALECTLETLYLTAGKLGRPVTCCTEFADLDGGRPSAEPGPLALAGLHSMATTLAAYALINAIVVALALLHSRRDGARSSWWPRCGLALLAGANLVVTQWSWLDAIAPRVLGLPYHHCVYEVLTRAPAMGFAAILALAGNLALIGMVPLALARPRAPAAFDRLEPAVERFAALALISALLVVAVHLV